MVIFRAINTLKQHKDTYNCQQKAKVWNVEPPAAFLHHR